MKLKLLITLVIILITSSYLLLYQKGKLSDKQVSSALNNCTNISSLDQKQQCWEKSIEETLEYKGLDSAFNLVDHLYSNEPQFASDCHDFTHLLGEKAYQLFAKNQNINLSSKATYCGFGFYHAFMEKLLRTTGDLNLARKFCDDVGKQSGQNELSRLSCFHGIGHGLLEDIPNPYLKGDDKAIIKTPLSLCEQIARSEEEKNRCASGVFNVIAIYYSNPKSGLKANDNDPYLLCKNQDKIYFQEPCFDQMNTYVLFHLNQGDLVQASRFAEDIQKDNSAIAAMHGLAGLYGQSKVGKIEYDKVVRICKNIQPRLKSICLEGFLMGLFEGGQPDIEYIEGIKFCSSQNLNKEEQNFCFELLTGYLKNINQKNLADICVSLKQNYQYICD